MALPAYRLRGGDTGPRQQSNLTCGSACLTVARMLVDREFAHWIATGEGARPGSPVGRSPAERFAAYERIVHRRTNTIGFGRRGPNLPWPRSLGTPPWGALRELEHGAAQQGTRYGTTVLRTMSHDQLTAALRHLSSVVADGTSALLYVGSSTLPRHVVLILRGDGDDSLDIYDPADGSVRTRSASALARRELRISGWNTPWALVAPTGPRATPARARYAPLTDPDASPA